MNNDDLTDSTTNGYDATTSGSETGYWFSQEERESFLKRIPKRSDFLELYNSRKGKFPISAERLLDFKLYTQRVHENSISSDEIYNAIKRLPDRGT